MDNRKDYEKTDTDVVFGAKMLNLETIKEINRRVERMALDYDIPYPVYREPANWQKTISQ